MYCNGSQWVAYGSYDPAAGGGSCTNPAGVERDITYSANYHAYIYCDGTQWRKAQGTCAFLPGSRGSGYFVMTQSTWNGNLSRQVGANALCLTELTTNTNWKGYSDANSRGLLISTKVRAFLCDAGTGCMNPLPNTTYYFATVGDAAAGGASFTTDVDGRGPGDSANWSGASYFNGNYTVWTGRGDNFGGVNTATLWNTITIENSHNCSFWTDGSGTVAGGVGGEKGVTANTNSNRWGGGIFQQDCSVLSHLICMVDP